MYRIVHSKILYSRKEFIAIGECLGTTSGTAEHYSDWGASERRRRELTKGGTELCSPREILKSEASQSPGNAIKFTSFCEKVY